MKTKIFNTDAVILLAVSGFAFWLRAVLLPVKWVNIDELIQLFVITRPTIRSMLSAILLSSPQGHPLDYFIDYEYFHLIGNTTYLVFVPIIWGTMSVALTYLVGKKLWNRELGLLSSLQLALSDLHLEHSQMIRQYSLIVLLATASSYFFFCGIKNRKWILAYAVSIFLYQLSTPYAVCFWTVALAAVWVVDHPDKRKFLAASASACLAAGMWLLLVGRHLVTEGVYTYSAEHTFGWTSLYVLITAFSHGSGVPINIYLTLFAIGVGLGLTSKCHRFSMMVFSAMALLTLMMLFVSLRLAHYMFSPHLALALLPFYLMAASVPLVAIIDRVSRGSQQKATLWRICLSAGLAMAILLTALDPLKMYVFRQSLVKNKIDSCVQFLRAHLAPRDMIIFSNPNYGATVLHQFDPTLIFGMKSVQIKKGMAVFEFPANTNISIGQSHVPVYTLCELEKSFATIDHQKFSLLERSSKQSKSHVWLIYSAINYFKEEGILDRTLGLTGAELMQAAPTVFLEKDRTPNLPVAKKLGAEPGA